MYSINAEYTKHSHIEKKKPQPQPQPSIVTTHTSVRPDREPDQEPKTNNQQPRANNPHRTPTQ